MPFKSTCPASALIGRRGDFRVGGPHLSILDGDLAEQITDALGAADIPQSVTVTRQELDPASPEWAPVYVAVPYACQGWRDTYSTAERANGDVLVTDAKVFVIASTLAITPAVNNTVTVGGSTLSIITVQRDPAGACWTLQCRL